MIPPKRNDIHSKEADNVDSWLMSYADMITLLLAFFVLFLAAIDPKSEKMTAITNSLSGQFGATSTGSPFDVDGTYAALLGIIESEQLLQDVAIVRTSKGVALELASQAFFTPGSVQLNPEYLESLGVIAQRLVNSSLVGYMLTIEGHTSDALPNRRYRTNWHFSAAQAASLASYFAEKGLDATRIKVVGYGANDPKVPNLDKQGKPIPENRAQNRRIVILLERE